MLVVEQRATCRFAEDLRGKRPITAEARRILTTDKRNSIRQFFAGYIVTGFGFELVDYPSNDVQKKTRRICHMMASKHSIAYDGNRNTRNSVPTSLPPGRWVTVASDVYVVCVNPEIHTPPPVLKLGRGVLSVLPLADASK